MLGFGRRSPAQAPSPFVVGVGRSGTTLLRLMLDSHSELAIPAETHFIPELIDQARSGADATALCDTIVAARHWSDFALDGSELRGRIGELDRPGAADVIRAFYSLYAEKQGKPRWGDKTPGYVKRMRAIGAALPEARFVHLVRDGRDVALSRRRRGMGEGKSIAQTAELWRRRIESARAQARKLRGRYLELRFEDLVADPEPGLREICEVCALGFDPAMLEHHARAAERLEEMSGDLAAEGARRGRGGDERLAAHALARRPPAPERAGAWRSEMSASERAEFEAVAGKLLADLGYEL